MSDGDELFPVKLEAGFQADLKRVMLPANRMIYSDISKFTYLTVPFLPVIFLLKPGIVTVSNAK